MCLRHYIDNCNVSFLGSTIKKIKKTKHFRNIYTIVGNKNNCIYMYIYINIYDPTGVLTRQLLGSRDLARRAVLKLVLVLRLANIRLS